MEYIITVQSNQTHWNLYYGHTEDDGFIVLVTTIEEAMKFNSKEDAENIANKIKDSGQFGDTFGTIEVVDVISAVTNLIV